MNLDHFIYKYGPFILTVVAAICVFMAVYLIGLIGNAKDDCTGVDVTNVSDQTIRDLQSFGWQSRADDGTERLYPAHCF